MGLIKLSVFQYLRHAVQRQQKHGLFAAVQRKLRAVQRFQAEEHGAALAENEQNDSPSRLFCFRK